MVMVMPPSTGPDEFKPGHSISELETFDEVHLSEHAHRTIDRRKITAVIAERRMYLTHRHRVSLLPQHRKNRVSRTRNPPRATAELLG